MKKIAQMCVITLVAASAILAANNPMVGGHQGRVIVGVQCVLNDIL